MSGRTVQGEVGVWLTERSYIGPAELKAGDDTAIVRGVTFSVQDMAPLWTRIGTAQVTIELQAGDDIVNSRVNSLRDQQRRIKADAERQSTEIEQQIQTLLAICYDGGSK